MTQINDAVESDEVFEVVNKAARSVGSESVLGIPLRRTLSLTRFQIRYGSHSDRHTKTYAREVRCYTILPCSVRCVCVAIVTSSLTIVPLFRDI
jgi:hypothetical protein